VREATDSGRALFDVAQALFAEVHRGRKVRLLGIYTSHFGEEKAQLGLFDAPAEPAPIDQVRDEIARRFGDEAITRASLLGRRERRNASDKPPR
jgi:hypothetical protein